jgi:sporulation protein YlmC with PRC-barrel domain
MMRAVELIGCEVVDRDGARIGRVCDLRLVADPHTRGLSGYHLESLVTRTGPIGDRLGYTTEHTVGPWSSAWLFRRFGRLVRLVPWRDVEAVDGRVIRLRAAVGVPCEGGPRQ